MNGTSYKFLSAGIIAQDNLNARAFPKSLIKISEFQTIN